MSESATQEKKAPFVMPKKTETAAPKIDDPMEWYKITNHEFPNLKVQVSWDGGGPDSKAEKSHYFVNGRQKRWEFESGTTCQIPRSLADYLNGAQMTPPDPELVFDPVTKQMVTSKLDQRRTRYSAILVRGYVPPAETKV
jgi:hypothetical protein